MPRIPRVPAGRSAPKVGDLRVLAQAGGEAKDPIEIRRQVLADFCKLVESQKRAAVQQVPGARILRELRPPPAPVMRQHIDVPHLSPRMRQTLRLLLQGDSEKQIALKLSVSPNTVHVYVKALYRGFDVNSRGELLSRFLSAGETLRALTGVGPDEDASIDSPRATG